MCFLSSSGSWNLSVACFTMCFFLLWLLKSDGFQGSLPILPWRAHGPFASKTHPALAGCFQEYEAQLMSNLFCFQIKDFTLKAKAGWDPLCRFGQAKAPGNSQVSVSLKNWAHRCEPLHLAFPDLCRFFTCYYTNIVLQDIHLWVWTHHVPHICLEVRGHLLGTSSLLPL